MFSTSFSILAGLIFFLKFYIFLIFSVIICALPSLKNIINFKKFKKTNNWDYLTGFDMQPICFVFISLIFLIILTWSGPSTSLWFGNLIIGTLQIKMSYFILFFFWALLTVYMSSFYFSSKETFDYLLILFNFLFWTLFLFFVNNLFTFIFLIEILSTLIFLLIITSTFSDTYFYNNLNLNIHTYFANSSPLFFVQTLLFFFWMSLISSLNLFLSLIFFYLKFFSFDWFLFEYFFFFLINTNQLKEITFISFVWFNFLFCIFLKCGLVPFYFWKPTFFKGLPIHALFFYISFFYFFLIFFLILFILIYFNEIFTFFININIILIFLGLIFLFFIISETFYLKSFLAISSILNTLFIFLVLNAHNLTDFLFNL